MKRYIIFFLLLNILILNAQEEEEVLILSLKEAQELAINNSQDVALVNIELDKAKAQVKQALAALLPQVNASLSSTQYGKLPSTIFPNTQAQYTNQVYSLIEDQFAAGGNPLPVPISQNPEEIVDEATIQFGKKFNINAEIIATQVVFNGVFLVGVKAANTFISIVDYQKELTTEKVQNSVKISYYQVLAAKENINVLQKNIYNIQKLKDVTSALFENGFAEEIDVDRLQLSINNLNVQLNQAKRQVELVEYVLKFQMGIDIYKKIELVGGLKDYLETVQFDLPEKGDFTSRTEIPFFDAREKVNEYNVKRYQSSYYPSINFYASLGTSAQRDKYNFFNFGNDIPWLNQRYFGFEINVPIWDSFGKKSQIQYAKLEINRIQAERIKLFNGMDLEFETAKNNLIKSKGELDFAEENIKLAEKIYDITKIKYKEGVGSSIEMTNAERDMYNAQANQLMAIYNLLIARADVDKALGNY